MSKKAAAGVFRAVTQRVNSASLLIDNVDKWVSIERGLIYYISFKKGATPEHIPKIVDNLLKLRLILPPGALEGRPESVIDQAARGCAPHILVIPQANLTSKVNRANIQYHGQLDKEEGRAMYELFLSQLREAADVLVTAERTRLLSLEAGQDKTEDGAETAPAASSEAATPPPPPSADELAAAEAPTAAGTGGADQFQIVFQNGTFGNRQGLRLEADGPFTHAFDF